MSEEYVHPAASGKPDSLVILLHGYGSNGADLIGLAPYWAPAMPNTEFLAPDAFSPGEMGSGFQWFTLNSWNPADMYRVAQEAAAKLQDYITERIHQYGIPASRVALVGFSQGTMMSLLVAPRRKEPLAGVLGYSGALLAGETLATDATARMPVHLIHGDLDPVVTVAAWYNAMEQLQAAGFVVTGNVTRGLVHSIDERGLDDGLHFLQKCLKYIDVPG